LYEKGAYPEIQNGDGREYLSKVFWIGNFIYTN